MTRSPVAVPAYTVGEEIANSVSHGIGILLSCAAIALLVYGASIRADAWAVVSCAVYGVTLFMLYTASTLYHAIPFPRVKALLKKADHIAIFFLIAGTYTPFALITMRGAGEGVAGWTVFGVEWGAALIGCAFKAFFAGRFRAVSTLVYLAMGWVAIFTIRTLWRELPTAGAWLLISGGMVYTFGAVFYLMKRIPYFHSVWHLFVLAGSVLHFLCVFLYVF